jgi:hypothetical protein
VLVAYSFNNLMAIDELAGTVTMDFYFRLYWQDQRWNFPSFWEAIETTTAAFMISDGAEISGYIRNENNMLEMWMPDIHFVDGKEQEVLEETIKIRPNGVMFWSRHMVVTIQQPGFLYLKYPEDHQQIILRVESYGLNSNGIIVNFTNKAVRFAQIQVVHPVSFIKNNGVPNFNANPVWSYDGYRTQLQLPDYGTSAKGPTAYFTQPVVYIGIIRKSAGIIYRLALPIMLLLLLVGLTFWMDHSARVDSTITILLAISALYIVIFSSIPMLGYLTAFDDFIIAMFIMIIGAVFMHSFTDRLILKSDTYPLRLVLIRILEFVGKVFIIPGVFCYFCFAFPTFANHSTVIPSLVVMFCMFGFIASRELGGFKSAVRLSMVMIRNKIENPAAYSLSNLEVFVFNLKMFGVLSRSPSHYHRWKRQVDKKLAEDGNDGAPVPAEMEMAAFNTASRKGDVPLLRATITSRAVDEDTSTCNPILNRSASNSLGSPNTSRHGSLAEAVEAVERDRSMSTGRPSSSGYEL